MQAIPTDNDTASPSSTLYLFHQPAGGSASSVLSIGNTGLIKFAPGQLFPGTLTGALATSPLVAGVAGNNLTLQLNIPTLATSLNSYFPQLSVANTFHASQTVQGGLTVTGNITANNIGATANLTAGVVSLTGSILAATSHVATAAGGFNSPLFEMGASAFNSTTAAAQNETFYWQAVPTGNNTTTPSANLQLSFSAGTASPAATGLSIGANGIIHFASAGFPVREPAAARSRHHHQQPAHRLRHVGFRGAGVEYLSVGDDAEHRLSAAWLLQHVHLRRHLWRRDDADGLLRRLDAGGHQHQH